PPTIDATTAATADHAVAVSLSATDGATGTGIASITYQVGNNQPVTVTNAPFGTGPFSVSFVISSQGTTHIAYSATDRQGNTSAVRSPAVGVATTPPDIVPTVSPAATPDGWTPGNFAIVNVAVTDGGSGVGAVTYGSAGVTAVPAGTPLDPGDAIFVEG